MKPLKPWPPSPPLTPMRAKSKPRRLNISLAATLAAFLALAAAAGAQTAPAYMSHPPAVGPVPAFTPPPALRDHLPNGLRLVIVHDPGLPLVTVRLRVRGGSSLLEPAQAGLATAEADLLTAGVPGMDARQIADAADSFGGAVSAAADKDFLTVSASSLAPDADAMFQLLAAVALRPTFPEAEVALRKRNMLRELQLDRADPQFLADVEFARLLFGPNPYAITAPTPRSIAAITRAGLEAYHARVFLPNNDATLVVVGDLDPGVARNLAERYFLDWPWGRPPQPQFPPPPARSARRVAIVSRPGSAQSTILLGGLGVERAAADYVPFLVANEIVGGSFSSRLNHDIRESKGYAYFIYSYNQPHLEAGVWRALTQVRTAVTAPALAETLNDLAAYRQAAPSASELRQAKNYIAGSFARNLETQEQIADEFLMVDSFHLPADYLAEFVPRVQRVSSAAALAAAREHILPEKALVIVVGDAPQIEAGLARLTSGEVKIFDAAGALAATYPQSGVRPVVKP